MGDTCPDCGAEPGARHPVGCDVARCTGCGAQHLTCDTCNADPDVWTGEWPGVADARRLGVVTSGGEPDLGRLPFAAYWSRPTQRWEARP